jgi:hypothetical protein
MANLDVPCTGVFSDFCAAVKTHPKSPQQGGWDKWPFANKQIFLQLLFFSKPQAADQYVNGRKQMTIADPTKLPVADWELGVGAAATPAPSSGANALKTQ